MFPCLIGMQGKTFFIELTQFQEDMITKNGTSLVLRLQGPFARTIHLQNTSYFRCIKNVSLHTAADNGFDNVSINQPETDELISSYADNFTATASSRRVKAGAEHLARHAEEVTKLAEGRSLQVSDQKSAVTLFTSQYQQSRHHPRIPVNGSPLPHD